MTAFTLGGGGVTFRPKEVTQVSPIPMDIEAMDEKIMQKDVIPPEVCCHFRDTP